MYFSQIKVTVLYFEMGHRNNDYWKNGNNVYLTVSGITTTRINQNVKTGITTTKDFGLTTTKNIIDLFRINVYQYFQD